MYSPISPIVLPIPLKGRIRTVDQLGNCGGLDLEKNPSGDIPKNLETIKAYKQKIVYI